MQGVRLSRSELLRQYGVSQRLAVRIGALMAKKLDVTAAVLEMCGPGAPCEQMILHPAFLGSAEEMDTSRLEIIARETGAQADGPFVMVEQGEWRTLALMEEQLAEEGWQEASAQAEEATAITRISETSAPAPVLSPEEQNLFSAEELARLKMEALTSAESQSRVSALRKLRMAPLSAQEKGNIFLKVLLDPISPARSEAIKGLEEMGFNRDTAETIQDMLELKGQPRRAAIERVGAQLTRLSPQEQQIVLRVLVEGLREFAEPETQQLLLRVLGEACHAFAQVRDLMEETVRLGFRKAIELPAGPAGRVTEFLYRLASYSPQGLDDILWHELETLRDLDSRALALTLLAQLELDDAQRTRLAAAMVEDLLREELEELQRQKIGHNLVSLGGPALAPLLDRFISGSVKERVMIVPLLDMLVVDQPFDVRIRNDVAARLLDCLRVAERRLRVAVYHTRVFSLPGLRPRLRHEIAETLIGQIHATDHPDLLDRISDILEGIGGDAVEALSETLRHAPRGETADLVARILGRTGASLIRSGCKLPNVKSLLKFLRKEVADPKNSYGGCALALGALAAEGAESEAAACRDVDLLLARLTNSTCQAEILEALGLLAASPLVDLPRRLRTTQIFAAVIESSEHEDAAADMRELDTPEGLLYEFSGQVAFDTDALPVVVEALERLYFAEVATDALKQRIVGQLTEVWEKVASWQVIWGPRSSEMLAMALGRIGADPDTPVETCLAIARSMSRQINRISVLRAVTVLYTSPIQTDEFNDHGVDCGRSILEQWDQPETSMEERQIVLHAAGRIAARPQLRARRPKVRDLRHRTAALLFDALNEGAEWAWEPLRWIRDCETIPKNQRDAIADRLRKASALIRLDQ